MLMAWIIWKCEYCSSYLGSLSDYFNMSEWEIIVDLLDAFVDERGMELDWDGRVSFG